MTNLVPGSCGVIFTPASEHDETGTVRCAGLAEHPRVIAVSDEHSRIRNLKQKWHEEDAARDTQEGRAQQILLEVEANETFVPIEDFLTRD